MKIARVAHEKSIGFAVIEGDEVAFLAGPPIGEIRFSGDRALLSDCRLLAPVLPSKVVCVSGNYTGEHAEPLLFLKPSTAVIGPGEAIRKPAVVNELMHEPELAVVVSGLVRNADEQTARDAILGYTIANDVTAADLQERDGQWARAKGFDTFCPLGPWIDTTFDAEDASIEILIDGVSAGGGSTKEMRFSPEQLVAYVSSIMTLLPGDVILTGTPSRAGPTKPGVAIEIAIDGLGALRNVVQ